MIRLTLGINLKSFDLVIERRFGSRPGTYKITQYNEIGFRSRYQEVFRVRRLPVLPTKRRLTGFDLVIERLFISSEIFQLGDPGSREFRSRHQETFRSKTKTPIGIFRATFCFHLAIKRLLVLRFINGYQRMIDPGAFRSRNRENFYLKRLIFTFTALLRNTCFDLAIERLSRFKYVLLLLGIELGTFPFRDQGSFGVDSFGYGTAERACDF